MDSLLAWAPAEVILRIAMKSGRAWFLLWWLNSSFRARHDRGLAQVYCMTFVETVTQPSANFEDYEDLLVKSGAILHKTDLIRATILFGKVHSVNDQPAVVLNDRSMWFYRGEKHRVGGPAQIGSMYHIWYLHGQRHRVDGPALDGKTKIWYYKGRIHRNDGPARITASGAEAWFHHGERVDPPGRKIGRVDLDLLPIELVIYIAQMSQLTWEILYFCYPPITKYTQTESGRRHFVARFTRELVINNMRINGVPAGNHTTYELFDRYHREDDLPAVMNDLEKIWYRAGQIWRADDRPAVERSDGTRIWFLDGQIGRADDQPAMITADSTYSWYQLGKPHRIGGPAYICPDCEIWYNHGRMHRTDGPAYINTEIGEIQWFINGEEIAPPF